MKRLLILLWFCVFVIIPSIAQPDLRKIKKQIPVKGITSVEPVSFSDQLFLFQAKSDAGLWDTESQTILISHLKEISVTSYQDNWIFYSATSEYGIYDLNEKNILVHSNSPIFLEYSEDSNLVNIINSEVLGFLDREQNRSYWTKTSATQDTTFFDDGKLGHGCTYSAEDKKITYWYGITEEYEGEEEEEAYGYEEFISIRHQAGYAWESGRVFNLETGQLMLENLFSSGKEWKGLIVTNTHKGKSYYDKDLNPIFINIKGDEYTLEHFRYLADSSITEAKYIGNTYTYLCKSGHKQRFYSSLDMEPVSQIYDFTFPIGYDFLHDGHSFFTVKECYGYGLFNTWRQEELEPKYTIIEKRAFPDGSYWYRADDDLHLVRRFSSDSAVVKKWNPAMEKTSTVINHIGVHDDNLVISLRATSADTHDSYYYTATDFDPGSGVIDLTDTTWRIEPWYHTITPFKGHYVAMEIGSSYRNASWLQTTLLDKNFEPITDRKFGYAFIFNDMLILKSGMKYVLYDVEKNKVTRELGLMNETDADFKFQEGYLVIGDNNYETKGQDLTDMDISDIISPKGELVKLPLGRFRFKEMLGEELVIIGRIKKDEPTNVDLHEQKVDAFAIFDLRTGKLITPWCDRIFRDYMGDNIYYRKDTDNESEHESIPIKEIRARFSK